MTTSVFCLPYSLIVIANTSFCTTTISQKNSLYNQKRNPNIFMFFFPSASCSKRKKHALQPHYSSKICVFFRKETCVLFSLWVKIPLRKQKTLSSESGFPKKAKECRTMSNRNNQINVPQAKQAMEQFKMQAAQDEDVSSTS